MVAYPNATLYFSSVSTADPPSSNPLLHLYFSSNSDSGCLEGTNQSPDRLADLNSGSNTNPEPEFVSPSSALAMADNTDGSVSARDYPQGTSVIETQFPETFNTSLPDSVTLPWKLLESVPLYSPSDPPLDFCFSSNFDYTFHEFGFQNIESSCRNSSEKVMHAFISSSSSTFTRVEKPDGSLPQRNNQSPDRLADLNSGSNTNTEPEFVSPSSALAMADNTDGSVSARDYPQGTSVIETQFPVGFNTSLPNSVTLGRKLPESVPLDDDDRTSLQGTADGGNEGMVDRKVDEVIGSGGENVEQSSDKEMVDLIEHHSICAPSESDRDEIQQKSPGTLNAEKHQVNCKLPKIGMVFLSEAAAYEFYKNYATNIGFVVRKGKPRQTAKGELRQKELLCNREGSPRKKQCNESNCERTETRIGCKAMIRFTIEDGKWVVSKLNLQHNHKVESSSQMCKSDRNISYGREIIESVNEAGMEKDAADTQNEEFHGMDCNNFSRDKKMSVRKEVVDGCWKETIGKRKRSSSLDPSKLMDNDLHVITKCGARKDAKAIVEKHLNKALKEVEDANEVASSNTSGFGSSETQKILLNSPCDDPDEILKGSEMKKRYQMINDGEHQSYDESSSHHQPAIKTARGECIQALSTGSYTRISSSQAEERPPKYTNTCPQTQTSSSTTFHDVEANPIMAVDMLESAPLNVPTCTHNQRNLEKDKGKQVLVQTNPLLPMPQNDKTKPRACRLPLGSIDRVVANGHVHERHFLSWIWRGSLTLSSPYISSSQAEERPPKYTNTCPQTQTSSSSTFHDVEANPIMAVDMLVSAPLNVPTCTHYNQRNLEKDEGKQVLVQTNPLLPMPQNDKTKPRACRLPLGSIDRVVANGHVHERHFLNWIWRGSFTLSSPFISSSQAEERPPKYTNTCTQTQTSSSTFHDVEADPIMAVDMLVSAPLNVPTCTHYNLRNLDKDKGKQVLVQTNPPLPMPQNDKTKLRACRLPLGSIDRVVANGHVHERHFLNWIWRGSLTLSDPYALSHSSYRNPKPSSPSPSTLALSIS